jgi:hypothetical protein
MDCAHLLLVVPQRFVDSKQIGVTCCCAAISGEQLLAVCLALLACVGVSVFFTQCPVCFHGRKDNNIYLRCRLKLDPPPRPKVRVKSKAAE